MTSGALPKSIALHVGSTEIDGDASSFYCRYDTSVVSGYDETEPAHSPATKIIVEQSTVNNKYVHLRFYMNNKYWNKYTENNVIVAGSNQPIEDTTDPSCTLFEPTFPSQNEVNFTHVQTGWRVIAKEDDLSYTLYIEENSSGTNLAFVDRETLVVLPDPVAFIHGKYLKAYDVNGKRLQFGSDKATDKESLHSARMRSNGMVLIFSTYFDSLWWVNTSNDSNWIYGGDYTTQDSSIVPIFKPVKIDEISIALLNASVNKYCVRSTDNCLAATSDTITQEAIIFVDELVMERQILNVNYALDDQRIYGATPFIAGTTTLTNRAPVDLIMPVEITYTDEKSYTFSRGGGRLNAGVKHTIQTTLWFISHEETIIPGDTINEAFEWDAADTTETEVTAVGTVSVPKNSTVTVSYVGTKGICSIPFTYTKADKSAIDGKTSFENSVRGGMYEGVSCYNFSFQVDN